MSATRWGLERIEALMEELGHPERSFRVFHIAGTNGKGSTACFAASILGAAGFDVGLYTSPHLSDVRERFRVAGGPVPEDLLQTAAGRILACDAVEAGTYFEVTTALALSCFAEHGAEFAVLETGLGGRLDATNVVAPVGTAITSIGIDHTEHLGSSLAQVAGEKAGIMKPETPAALGPLPLEALEAVLARAQVVGAPVRRLGRDAHVGAVAVRQTGTSFLYRSPRWPDGLALRTRLVGAHQADNAGLAGLMLEASLPELGGDVWARGILDARLPGRFELHTEPGRMWVFDIAHNPMGVRVLTETLRRADLPRPWVAVVCILADKPWERMLDLLWVDMDAIILTQAASVPEPRRWNPENGSRYLAREGGRGEVRVVPELHRALEVAAEETHGGSIIVTGSAHTVGSARIVAGYDVG